MNSTMQDCPLTLTSLFRHGAAVYGASEVITDGPTGVRIATFAAVAERAARLASALQRLGVRPGDRVATFAWNTQEHLEAYLAVPCMGAVIHTLNIRLSAEHLEEIILHAQDRVLIVDASLLEQLAPLLPRLACVESVIVFGGEAPGLPAAHSYEKLLAQAQPLTGWPQLDELSAAGLCYTSGTTGSPKGVAYSHRSQYLHAITTTSGAATGLSERDRVLPIVPMFHANAWGFPYAAWLVGADLVLPGRSPNAKSLSRLIAQEKPTIAAAVPSVWIDVMQLGESTPLQLGSLRMVVVGGAALPMKLMRWYQ
jgi:fatty-acyl-CoA synthase